MSDRTDPMSAAARHINGGGPLAPFLSLLTEKALGDLAVAAQAAFERRIDEWRATLCDHPPTRQSRLADRLDAALDALRWPAAGRRAARVAGGLALGVEHHGGPCAHAASVVERAMRLVYHPRGATGVVVHAFGPPRRLLHAVHVAPVEDA